MEHAIAGNSGIIDENLNRTAQRVFRFTDARFTRVELTHIPFENLDTGFTGKGVGGL